MQALTLSSAEITTMIYPTEVEERVKRILLSLFTPDGEVEIEERKLTSHYGYSFRELVLKLDRRSAESLLRSLICSLSDYDFLSLMETLESHVDGRNLYIRLDKQELALGRYSLFSGGSGGYVRVKLTFRGDLNELRSNLSRLREGRCLT